MVEELESVRSRITILEHPLICRLCTYDEFIPYRSISNAEDPGIGVLSIGYCAVCIQCGCVTDFGDPSHPSEDGLDYIWAFKQTIV
ncbi:hypothetical protein [Sporosarcina sp. P1]|uniref:hypothetical protein n=1 Tax=Sporosarcina sp. P1 TaxID=2048257 RepID=UPI000C16BF00|nr:hypothetical protein [Sporosarcina sp. P1]PIC83433.1 hypothetical protein CSV73_07690 [Sporosarcina sp. P1]